MNKPNGRVALFLVLPTLLCCLDSCGGTPSGIPEKETYDVSFDFNYENAPSPLVVAVKKKAAVSEPETPIRSHYVFTHWYSESTCQNEVDFERAITADTTYYAGWNQSEVTVTFDPNYDGAIPQQTSIKKGSAVSEPASLSRSGYLFNGWYQEKTCATAFDFTTLIQQDLTLYAGWKADSGDNVTITYLWNYDGAPDQGIYSQVVIAKNSKTSAPTPSRENYYLVQWCRDAAGSEAFDFNARISADVTLYAHWFHIAQFEAEYIDFTNLSGFGYSGEASGTSMIEKDTYHCAASNGFYVGWLYKPQLTLSFHITSSAAVTNAYLSLRLSAEFYSNNLTLNDEEFLVKVNGVKVSYSDLFFDLSSATSTDKLDFSDRLLSKGGVALASGENEITLTINNDTKFAGTMYAKAPMVDRLDLYSDATLTWGAGFPRTSNIAGK